MGCGIGDWTAVFGGLGCDVLGIDGDYVDRAMLKIPATSFRPADLNRRLSCERRFDLAVSLEVAEHLPPSRADSFVADLAELAPAVLFSAAIPNQTGDNHINEQWPEYWADLFEKHQYRPIDCVRRAVWDRPDVDWWYAQNTFLYVREDRIDERLKAAASKMPMRIVHPGLIEHQLWEQQEALRWEPPPPPSLLRRIAGRAVRAVQSLRIS